MRIKATISYDGSHFFGFQSQKSSHDTVVGSLNVALKNLGIDSNIVGAGRTDKGVHATNQIISFDLPPFWNDPVKLKKELNQKLKYIKIKKISVADNNFHARFDANKREYIYIFKTNSLNVFEQNHIGYYDDFDEQKLKSVLKIFEGMHDFKLFCKTDKSQINTICNVYKTRYKKYKNYHIIKISANRFLRSQVRMIVEASMKYAMDQISLEMLIEQLKGDKKHSTTIAPATGLYLSKVIY
ncbi:MAG: tRNA pseudouridine(38-40) synthase TruA [Epsilonproteobacteria bacterium]|nr:tRNA pseudouridine(38-40) synthase TruA [Campylobacterota bacterium]